ncbi:MAG: class I poly(R)-hydroxyalkanoic acid synthase, partial [Burkholderiales bacterium]|nr:class I poly(R)-hydroxyalkanoic acid synthase [Burkholderiales bacterium]
MSGANLPVEQIAAVQGEYLKNATEIWNLSLQRVQGETAPAIGDRRFANAAWLSNPASAYTAQMYLLNARTLMQMAESFQGD